MKRCSCGATATNTTVMCYHSSTPNNLENIISIGYFCDDHSFDRRSDRPQYTLLGIHSRSVVEAFYASFDDAVDIDYMMEVTSC